MPRRDPHAGHRTTPQSANGRQAGSAHLSGGFLGFLPAVAQSSSLATVDVALAPFSHQRSAAAAGFLAAFGARAAAMIATGAGCDAGRTVGGVGGDAGLTGAEASPTTPLAVGAAVTGFGRAVNGAGSSGDAVSEAAAGVTRRAGSAFSAAGRDEPSSTDSFTSATAGEAAFVGVADPLATPSRVVAAGEASSAHMTLVGTKGSSAGYV